jgi:leucyl/phenylalanyl-tRNA--protein transferase
VRSILELPHLGADPQSPFPAPEDALQSPNGLLAWGGDLHPQRLLQAYRMGTFPWYSEGQPILWWNPAPRCVLFPGNVYLSKRTRRRYNSGVFRLSIDLDFESVIEACAQPREYEETTWITRDMKEAYLRLHQSGHAHSLEVWKDGALAGGIYGLSLGRIFFGESMFSSETDASKIALVALCRLIDSHGYALLDCQVGNPHLYSMGAEEISREAFQSLLAAGVNDLETPLDWSAPIEFDERW